MNLDIFNPPRGLICHSKYPGKFKEFSHSLGRKRSFKVDAAFWVIAGFDHFVITIKIASEVKMRNRIKEFLSLR
jgi:hypothetical protein